MKNSTVFGNTNTENEEFFDQLEKQLEKRGITIPNEVAGEDWLVDSILAAKDLGYGEGYVDGRGEERMSSD